MKIATSADERTNLTDFVIKYLQDHGHEVHLFGALRDKNLEWVDSSKELAEAVVDKKCDEGILFCWTGTGACMTANKIPTIRAALCLDSEEAKGAKTWNHANVLVMSLRMTSEPVAEEILNTWFSTEFGKEEFDTRNMNKLKELEARYFKVNPEN